MGRAGGREDRDAGFSLASCLLQEPPWHLVWLKGGLLPARLGRLRADLPLCTLLVPSAPFSGSLMCVPTSWAGLGLCALPGNALGSAAPFGLGSAAFQGDRRCQAQGVLSERGGGCSHCCPCGAL